MLLDGVDLIKSLRLGILRRVVRVIYGQDSTYVYVMCIHRHRPIDTRHNHLFNTINYKKNHQRHLSNPRIIIITHPPYNHISVY